MQPCGTEPRKLLTDFLKPIFIIPTNAQNDIYQRLSNKSTEFWRRITKGQNGRRLKIRQMARMIGVTNDTVISWEIKGIEPNLKNLGKIEAVLDRLES